MPAARKNILVLALLAFLSLAALPATASAAPRCSDANTRPGKASEAVLSKATVCLINRERTRRGRRALRTNRRLSLAALSHSRDMINKRYFQHVSKSGLDVVDRLISAGYLGRARSWFVGENLAWGTGSRSTPRETVIGWMNSPGHRRNMLNARFRERHRRGLRRPEQKRPGGRHLHDDLRDTTLAGSSPADVVAQLLESPERTT